MNTNFNSSPSFGAYVPVKFYAKDTEENKIRPIATRQYIKKCQSFVVRNLNGTAKKAKSDEFVKFYKKFDSDYRNIPHVASVYDKDSPTVYMVTGKDTDTVKNCAKKVGVAKGQSMDYFGHSHSFEAKLAARSYFDNVKDFISKHCKRLKSPSTGGNMTLEVLFEPKYNKNGDVKSLDYVNARLVTDNK